MKFDPTKRCGNDCAESICADCLPAAIESAARKLFTVKGRHHSQIAMCELGELLGYPVVWPVRKEKAE